MVGEIVQMQLSPDLPPALDECGLCGDVFPLLALEWAEQGGQLLCLGCRQEAGRVTPQPAAMRPAWSATRP